jgi:hypothetical protein
MKNLSIQLDDLPDEILIYIFKKLYNHEVLYSLMGVNQRFNRIVHEKIFTRDLCLLEYCSYNDFSLPTNNFQGGLFTNVTEVSLYDEHPFECEFFLRIAQSLDMSNYFYLIRKFLYLIMFIFVSIINHCKE